jgi:hypothetical protein
MPTMVWRIYLVTFIHSWWSGLECLCWTCHQHPPFTATACSTAVQHYVCERQTDRHYLELQEFHWHISYTCSKPVTVMIVFDCHRADLPAGASLCNCCQQHKALSGIIMLMITVVRAAFD